MKSWYLNGVKDFGIVSDEETSELSHEMAKIKIIRASVCASDLVLYQGGGKYPITPCRIATGLISESSNLALCKGQRVLLNPYNDDYESLKVNGYDLNGYLSDYVIRPLDDIIHVPESISDESICFIEDIALAVSVMEKLDVSKTDYLGLYGVSALNMIIAQLASYYQAIPIIIDDDQNRLEFALDNDVVYTINTKEEDLQEKLKEITSGKMLNKLIIDTDSYPEVGDLLFSCGKHASIGLIGYNPSISALKANLAPIISNELTIFGCNNGYEELSTAINLLATNVVSTDNLIEEIADFNDVPKVFEKLSNKRNYFKTIIKCY